MEFWEKVFRGEKTSWGFQPSDSAIFAKDFFLEHGLKRILIPGVGYGRNAKIFCENRFVVTGIEISKTAIDLARENGLDFPIRHGSVTNMPFDDSLYDGIFCYALLHLLNKYERRKFIANCYKQVKPNGYMIFMIASKKMEKYGTGRRLSKDRYKIMPGLNVFFYDFESVKKEFQQFGLMEYREIDEPIKHMDGEPPLKCILVICRK